MPPFSDTLRSTPLPRDNNFDLIRLFAALQVVIVHCYNLGIHLPWPLALVIAWLPGVPIFFFISGLLVTASLARRPLGSYAMARARRIFPALWIAFALAVTVLAAFGFFRWDSLADPAVWIWIVGQITVAQSIGPDVFAGFGPGVVNGALWTIPVEVGFYAGLPIIVWLASRADRPRLALTMMMVAGFVISFALLRAVAPVLPDAPLASKIVGGTTIGHFYWFALGVLAFVYLPQLLAAGAWLARVPLGWLIPITLYLVVANVFPTAVLVHNLGYIGALMLAAGVFSLGFLAPPRARLLRGVDLSYGIYVYHMLLLNSMIELSFEGWPATLVVVGGAIGLAALSWVFVESRALGRPAWIAEVTPPHDPPRSPPPAS